MQAAVEMAKSRQHFQQAHHRQILHREQRLESLFHHARAAHAGEPQARPGRAQRLHQSAAKHVAALFAGDQVDEGFETCRFVHASP